MNHTAEREAFRRLHDDSLDADHRQALRNTLIEQNLPLVDYCIRDVRVSPDLREDVLQAGREGLIGAVDRYDPDERAAFGTYARSRIIGQMLHYLRDQGSSIRLPRHHHGEPHLEIVSLDQAAEPISRDRQLLGAVDRVDLQRALNHLSTVERQVIDLYLIEEWSQARIAARLGMTQVQVSRMLQRTLRELRGHLAN